MLTKIEKDLIAKGYVFKKEFTGSEFSAIEFARKEREKGYKARVLKLRAFTHTVYSTNKE